MTTIALALPWLAQPVDGRHLPVIQIAQGEAGRLEPTDAYRLALLEMKGQLGVARALLQQRLPGADYHLGEALEAIFRSVEPELDRRSAPFTADTLEELKALASSDAIRALSSIDLAATAIDGSFAQTGVVDGSSVLALGEALLRKAVAGYAEAVRDNEVIDLPKYQSSRGLVTEAEALIRLGGGLKDRPGHAKVLSLVVLIRQAWPGVIPPPIVLDPLDVAGRLDEAVAAIEELR